MYYFQIVKTIQAKTKKAILQKHKFSFMIGPPAMFCNGKADGLYASPIDRAEYFFCTDGDASECESCGAGLHFYPNCKKCLEIGSSKSNTLTCCKRLLLSFFYSL